MKKGQDEASSLARVNSFRVICKWKAICDNSVPVANKYFCIACYFPAYLPGIVSFADVFRIKSDVFVADADATGTSVEFGI